MSYGPTEHRLVGGVHELLGEEAPGEEETCRGELLVAGPDPGAQAQPPPTERCQIRGQVGHPCSRCPQVGILLMTKGGHKSRHSQRRLQG